MNEIFDRLFIRIFFTIFICVLLWGYRYIHAYIYRDEKKQILKSLFLTNNPASTLHFFSRLIGIALIFSTLGFDETSGIFVSLFHFFIWGTISFALYLTSIYIVESILFYNFEFVDEVIKRKNLTYAIISFFQCVSISFLVRTVVEQSEGSLIILIMLWLFALVLFGFSSKLYTYVSVYTFNRNMLQKSLSLAYSYSGFILGITIIITTALEQEHYDITSYGFEAILRILLSLIIYPLFKAGINYVYNIRVENQVDNSGHDTDYSYGVYEGGLFLTTALLTSLIVGKISFSSIYPFF
ncbi:MAG: hypothetical protein JNM93_11455 [Bacteriovoracaceae bacterium]|nr:hypothetical protein [Bacteriovoracaceae bacterium]